MQTNTIRDSRLCGIGMWYITRAKKRKRNTVGRNATNPETMDATIIALHRAAPRSSLFALVDDASRVGGATKMLAGIVDAQCDIEQLREGIAVRLGLEYEPCVVKPASHEKWASVTLSRRETHVAVRVSAGLTSKQIAADLGVSLRTVHTYRESLARKLGASSAAVITRFVIERRIVQVD